MPEPLEQLKSLLPLWESATDGLWFFWKTTGSVECDMDSLDGVPREATTTIADLCPNGERDGLFIAASRNLDLPAIIAWAEGLQQQLAEACKVIADRGICERDCTLPLPQRIDNLIVDLRTDEWEAAHALDEHISLRNFLKSEGKGDREHPAGAMMFYVLELKQQLAEANAEIARLKRFEFTEEELALPDGIVPTIADAIATYTQVVNSKPVIRISE